MADVVLTWLGHGGFRVDSSAGKRIYVDPWLDNPNCPEAEKDPERIDILVLTHGHGDHVGNAAELGKRHSPAVVAIFELANWLEWQGVPGAGDLGMNMGGTVEIDGIKFTMTQALHSGGLIEGNEIVYLGDPVGYVVELENGLKVYFAGDTAAFGDMQLIGRLYRPDVAVLPISCMSPKTAVSPEK